MVGRREAWKSLVCHVSSSATKPRTMQCRMICQDGNKWGGNIAFSFLFPFLSSAILAQPYILKKRETKEHKVIYCTTMTCLLYLFPFTIVSHYVSIMKKVRTIYGHFTTNLSEWKVLSVKIKGRLCYVANGYCGMCAKVLKSRNRDVIRSDHFLLLFIWKCEITGFLTQLLGLL